jgi:hypothetical protein
VYGRSPPNLTSYISRTARVEAVGKTLEERDEVLKGVRLKLVQAQNRMKQVYDKVEQNMSFRWMIWFMYVYSHIDNKWWHDD